MRPDRPDAPGTPVPADAPELDEQLAAARQAVLDREERRQAERRSGRDRRRRPLAEPAWLAAATFSWLAVFLVVLSPPEFLRRPEPAPFRPPAGAVEASLRYGLWLADHRVQDFLARTGRLPGFLGEAGPDDRAIDLQITGPFSYRLVGRDGELELILTDPMAADSFAGNSLATLRQAAATSTR